MRAYIRPLKRLPHPGPVLTPGQCLRLTELVDGEITELLDFWLTCQVPWNARPTVPAYRTHSGNWLRGPDDAVREAIKEHVRKAKGDNQ